MNTADYLLIFNNDLQFLGWGSLLLILPSDYFKFTLITNSIQPDKESYLLPLELINNMVIQSRVP